eukprot:Partr_v1_DN28605_c0_g2_i1_m50233 putative ecotropic viral integration site
MEPLESPQSENRDVLAGYFGSSDASSPASPISPSPQSPPPPASSSLSAAAAVVQNDDDQVLIPSDSLKDVKPATFKGPPSRVKSKFSSPSSTAPVSGVSGGDPVVSTDRRRSSVSGSASASAAGDDKVSIVHSLVELKPTFSLDTVASSTSALDAPDTVDTGVEAEPLSQAEIDLLVRLERQNSELSQKQQSQAQILPVLSIPTSRTTYFRDVFSSASGSPVKESFVGASPLVDHLSLGSAAAASASVAPVKVEGDVEADWEFWGRLLNEFESTLKKHHKVLIKKIHAGLPRALRGTLWYNFSRLHPVSFLRGLVGGGESNTNDSHVSVLSNSSSLVSPPIGAVGAFRFLPPDAFRTASLEDAYVELLKLSSPYEKMIIRDLSRTFPKHEFFKHADGSGQESLFHVMKAYSLYDPEVGYCQGLSFIVGALLLNVRLLFVM